ALDELVLSLDEACVAQPGVVRPVVADRAVAGVAERVRDVRRDAELLSRTQLSPLAVGVDLERALHDLEVLVRVRVKVHWRSVEARVDDVDKAPRLGLRVLRHRVVLEHGLLRGAEIEDLQVATGTSAQGPVDANPPPTRPAIG